LRQKARNVKQALLAKGFREDKRDHYFYFFHYNGKKSNIYTKISHSSISSELSKPLCGLMARQIKLSGQQFQQLIDCPLTKDMYIDILVAGRHLTR
jgi:hypothetical protein